MNAFELFEAKFSKPITAYHGTHFKNIRSILKQGLKGSSGGGFGAHISGSMNQRDMTAVGGVYLTTSAQYAGYVGKEITMMGSYALVEVSVQVRSGYMDEDALDGYIDKAMNHRDGVRGAVTGLSIIEFMPSKTNELVAVFKKNVPGMMQSRESDIIRFMKAYYARVIAYAGEFEILKGIERPASFVRQDVDTIIEYINSIKKHPNEAERDYRQALDWITRSAKKEIHDFQNTDGPVGDNFRLAEDITFSGNNKITGIFSISDKMREIVVYYGSADRIKNTPYYSSFEVVKGYPEDLG